MPGNVRGVTIEFRGDTTSLDKALRKVRTDARDINKDLRSVNTALKFNPRNTELLAQKQGLLRDRVKQTEASLKDLKEVQAKLDADPSTDKQSREYQELRREIIETESKLKHFRAEAEKLNNVKLAALQQQLEATGKKLETTGRSLTQYVTLPLVAAGGVAVKKFADVDKTMQLTNATMGNTAEQADMLNQAMKDAASNSTYGMNDAATATLNFARAGLSAEEAADALAPAMALAAGEGGNLDTVSSGLVATINGFGGSFDEAGHYADVFANACNNSALDIDSLSDSMSVAAPVFAAAGYNVEDAALYMGVMANNGIEASVAANSLKTGFSRLVSPTEEAATWMEKLGISMTNQDGTMKDTVQIQKELHDAFAGLSESEQIAAASAIFGKNQMSPWLALINSAPGDVEALSTALEEDGTALEMQASMMEGFGGSIEKLKSGIDVMMTSLGEALAPTISKVGDGLQKVVEWFNALDPSKQQLIAKILVVIAALGPAMFAVGKAMQFVSKAISVGTKVISGLSKAMTFLAANPVVAIIAGIVALVAIFVVLWKKSSAFRAFWIKLWWAIKDTVTAVWTAIKTVITNAWNAIKAVWDKVKPYFQALWNGIKAVFAGVVTFYRTIFTAAWTAIKTVWNAAVAFFTGIWNGIKLVFSTVTSWFRSIFTSAWTAIKTVWAGVTGFFSGIWSGIKNTFAGVAGWFGSIFANAWSAIKSKFSGWAGFWSGLWSSVKSKFTSIGAHIGSAIGGSVRSGVNGAISKIEGVVNGAIGRINSVLAWVKKLPGTSWIGYVGKVHLPRMAEGGIVDSATVAMIGEGSQSEAVVPLDSFWKKLDKLSTGETNITININTQPGQNASEIAREVQRQLIDAVNNKRLAWQ